MLNFSNFKRKITSNPFRPQLLEEISSRYNPTLRVLKNSSGIYVTTGGLTQSGGLVNDLWKSTFRRIGPRKGRSWLILGLATGTVAKLVSAKYAPSQMTGVELDPVMLTLGRKYFGLDKIPRLTVINSDASKYLSLKLYQKYDYILVDMYIGDQLPDFVYTPSFISSLLAQSNPETTVVFNHLFYDSAKKSAAEQLTHLAEIHFHHTLLHRTLTNLLIICSRPLKKV